jgi:uncharacterized protein (TIGR03435 family)
VGEQAAHKRIARSLEKLRAFFAQRGVALTAAAVGGAMAANSVQAAPAGLAVTVTAAAAKGATVGGSTLTLLKGALKLMAWTQAKTAIVIGAGVLLAAGTTTVAVKEIQEHKTYSWQVKSLPWEQFLKTPPQVRILPTKFLHDYGGSLSRSFEGKDSKSVGITISFKEIIQTAFQVEHADRIIYRTALPHGGYDFIANVPHGSPKALQEEIKRKFDLVGRFETVETNVLLLKVKSPNAPGLKPSTVEYGNNNFQNGEISVKESIPDLAKYLEAGPFKIPVLDQTGLKGDFAFTLTWDANDKNLENLKQALVEQLGLELVPGVEPVEMLVVEKTK